MTSQTQLPPTPPPGGAERRTSRFTGAPLLVICLLVVGIGSGCVKDRNVGIEIDYIHQYMDENFHNYTNLEIELSGWVGDKGCDSYYKVVVITESNENVEIGFCFYESLIKVEEEFKR